MASRRRALLLAALALALCERRRCRMRQRPRRFWVRKISTEEAKKRGEWETLVEELTTNDREYFFKYLRMHDNFSLSICSISEEASNLDFFALGLCDSFVLIGGVSAAAGISSVSAAPC